jgi:hypothetical protein
MPREPLNPNHIFRECDAREIFGFATTVLKEKIKAGEIPEPRLLAAPPSRARGWWGWQVNEWAERVEKQQAEWEAAVTTTAKSNEPKRYVPTPPNNKKQPAKPTKLKGLKKPVRLPRRSAKG